ncbi:hypothetical protein NE237_025601 [Protea cynaroides]|uniref:Retrotransposon gag domain-containing protein n=1 Tax=Protea cynaroides TaxID=273540 RepID=A0A9Q0K1H4_9MAGN|nr:hypothetical protein NE237_025601 [Protea cynaroides]
MEKTLETLMCKETQKLLCATFQLEGVPYDWWKGIQPTLMRRHGEITLQIFKEAFYKNFFPQNFRDRKEVEYFNHSRGSTIVEAYQQKFEELFYFSPVSMRDEEPKLRPFVQALRGDIKVIVESMKLMSIVMPYKRQRVFRMVTVRITRVKRGP